MGSREEIEQTVQESRDLIADVLIRPYKNTDLKQTAELMAKGELIEAYVCVLNKEATYIASGGLLSDEEYKELKDMEHQCEHWIARRVLTLCGWKEKTAAKNYRQED